MIETSGKLQGSQQKQQLTLKQKIKKFRNLDFTKSENRRFLVSSFRKLDKIVNEKYKYCDFYGDGYEEQQQTQPVDFILKRAGIVEPYIKGNSTTPNFPQPQFLYQQASSSKVFYSQYCLNRQCAQPKVIIDQQIAFNFQSPVDLSAPEKKYVHSCFKSGSFLISIEAEPNCNIIMTKNGIHPFLAESKDVFVYPKSHQEQMEPPCTLCILATAEGFKLASPVLTIIVSKTGAKMEGNKNNSGMIRAQYGSELADSKSNASIFECF